MNKKVEISVVVPVYGCKGALMELYKRTQKTLESLFESYEIIYVDDNCPQNSWEIVEELCSQDPNVVGIKMSRNFGQMKAILAGLDASCGEWVVVMDCDLQDSPEDIEKLYDKAQEGYDIVFSRRKKRHDNKLKIAVSKVFYKIYSVLTEDCYDPAMSNYCICNRNVIDNFCKMRECHRAFTMYLKWLGFNSTIIDVEHSNRKEGKSSYSMRKRFKLAGDIIFSQSDKILQMIVKSGFVLSFISAVVAIIMVIRYFIYDIASGWTSIIVTLTLLGGLILVAIGCVGIYVGKTFIQVKNRPLYVVQKKIN